MHYQGFLYRAITPRYAAEPLSGEGARRFGGRFNAKGRPALYLACDVMTALNEANQIGHLQPTTVVSYQADISPLFDCRDAGALAAAGLEAEKLFALGWRDEMRAGQLSASQQAAEALAAKGYAGLIYPSLAPANRARREALCIALWRWPDAPASLQVIDDEDRLAALRQD